ncbi:MAG: hypothetical protein ACTHLE_12435 [Agriterribacter sp.]
MKELSFLLQAFIVTIYHQVGVFIMTIAISIGQLLRPLFTLLFAGLIIKKGRFQNERNKRTHNIGIANSGA